MFSDVVGSRQVRGFFFFSRRRCLMPLSPLPPRHRRQARRTKWQQRHASPHCQRYDTMVAAPVSSPLLTPGSPFSRYFRRRLRHLLLLRPDTHTPPQYRIFSAFRHRGTNMRHADYAVTLPFTASDADFSPLFSPDAASYAFDVCCLF